VKKSEYMLTLARLAELVDRMPNKLLVKEITKKECREIWDFVHTTNRLSISLHRLKMQLAKECGVMLERILEVADDKPFVEILTWESGDEPSAFTLKQVMELMRNAHTDENWILSFANNISVKEASLIWRWALDYRWYSKRNRFKNWLYKHSKLNAGYSFDIHLSVIYDGLQVTESQTPFKKLEVWDGEVPEKWWFVTDCATLKYVGDGIVRNRNGTLNPTFTPMLDSNAECWMWDNPTGTSQWHSHITPLPFSKTKEPMTNEWHEGQVLLESYAKGGFLIHHESKYYLKSNGTNTLYAQILTIQNLNKGGYEIVIGFSDAGEVVDATTLTIDTIPFSLDNALKRRGVNANIRHTFHNVNECLVGKFNYTWSPDDGWHLKFGEVEDAMGVDGVDDILDYYAITGGEDES